MGAEAAELLKETELKLASIHERLVADFRSAPRWVLIGTVRELLERCRILRDLGTHAQTKATAELVAAVVGAERLAGGARACELHPDRPATRTSKGASLCQECYEALPDKHSAEAK